MAFVLSLLMALVLVSYSSGRSLGCDLSQNHVLVGRKNLRLLGQMKRLSPRFCLQDRKDFAFPQEMVEGSQLQEPQDISVLHEMLQQTFNLFHTERSSAAWDTTLLEQLLTGLHQQLDDLDTCLGLVMGEKDFSLGRMGPTLAVKRYFQGIHVYLYTVEQFYHFSTNVHQKVEFFKLSGGTVFRTLSFPSRETWWGTKFLQAVEGAKEKTGRKEIMKL